MKIVFVNLNVGSAIEQSGNRFISLIKEVYNDILIFKDQNREGVFYNYLLNNKPNTVIVNGNYPRILTPLFYYKLTYPETKIIFISRVFDDFIFDNDTSNIYHFYYDDRLKNLFDLSDYLFIINGCGIDERIPKKYKEKTISCCGSNDPQHFKLIKKWSDRPNKFLLFGSLNPHKLNPDFLDDIQKTDIQIDAYGGIDNQPDWFRKKFENCKNINYLGYLNYDDIPNTLNQYKYYLLPHNGQEPLNNSIIQAILCGCIPIVFDDFYKTMDGLYWLKWAEGMYFGCDDMKNYINALLDINKQDINGDDISFYIRKMFIDKYGDPIRKIKDLI